MPPVNSNEVVKQRVEWLLSCGLRIHIIQKLGLDRPMNDDAFKLLASKTLRSKGSKS